MTWAMTAMVAGGATIGALTNKDDPGKGAMYGAAIGATGGVLGGVGAGAGMFGGALNMTAGTAAVTAPTTASFANLPQTMAPVQHATMVAPSPRPNVPLGAPITESVGMPGLNPTGPATTLGPSTSQPGIGGQTGIQKFGNFIDRNKAQWGQDIKGVAKQAAGSYVADAAKGKPSYVPAQPFRPIPARAPDNPYGRFDRRQRQPGFRGRR